MTYNDIANKIVTSKFSQEITVYNNDNVELFTVYTEKDNIFPNVYHMTVKIGDIVGKIYGLCTVEEISKTISELDNLTAIIVTRFGKRSVKSVLDIINKRKARILSKDES